MVTIIKKIEEVQVWPSTTKNHIKCLVKDVNGNQFESTLPKVEVKIIEDLQNLKEVYKIPQSTMIRIWNNIENYGQMKYNDGIFSESMDDESI